jgi:hypothetical protein
MYITLAPKKENQLAFSLEALETGQFLPIRQNGYFTFRADRAKNIRGGGGGPGLHLDGKLQLPLPSVGSFRTYEGKRFTP